MIDIKLIRENPELVRENIKKKFKDHKLPLVDDAIEFDRLSRQYQKEADDLRANRNKLSKQIGVCMKSGLTPDFFARSMLSLKGKKASEPSATPSMVSR